MWPLAFLGLFIAYMEGGVGGHRWCSFLSLDDRTLEVILDGYFGRADWLTLIVCAEKQLMVGKTARNEGIHTR